MREDTNVDELNSGKVTERVVKKSPSQEAAQREADRQELTRDSDVPLFLRYSSEGHKGDAQDEKDKSAE
ncbi:MAG: hypothetical protein AABN95_21550 [Acidobacteriota bacterium]